MTQRTVLTWQQTDMRIDAVCRRVQRLIEHPVATLDSVLCDLGTNEIERAALPCTPRLNGCVLGMEPAEACSDVRRSCRCREARSSGRPRGGRAGTIRAASRSRDSSDATRFPVMTENRNDLGPASRV